MSLRKSRFEVSAMNSRKIQTFLAGSALLLVGFVAGLLLGSRPTVPDLTGASGVEAAIEDPSIAQPGAGTASLLPEWTPGDATTASSVALGALASCVLWEDGSMDCWGSPQLARTVPPAGTQLQQFSVGDSHGCGIDANGATLCWGSSRDGKPMSAPEDRFVRVRAAPQGPGQGVQQCGLSPESIICWVPEWEGATITRRLEGAFVDFDIGAEQHLCAINESGALTCSGGLFPLDPPGDTAFRSVSVGWFFGCGVTLDGALRCFGANPDDPDAAGLTDGVPDGVDFTSVAVGELDACAVRWDGSTTCWGSNMLEPPLGVRLASIAVGAGHACGVALTGSPVCWGQDHMGQSTVPNS
jgi:hypothetical protein